MDRKPLRLTPGSPFEREKILLSIFKLCQYLFISLYNTYFIYVSIYISDLGQFVSMQKPEDSDYFRAFGGSTQMKADMGNWNQI